MQTQNDLSKEAAKTIPWFWEKNYSAPSLFHPQAPSGGCDFGASAGNVVLAEFELSRAYRILQVYGQMALVRDTRTFA